MQKLLRGRWWVAGLLLAAGCRSEQAAFSFRPAARPVAVAAAAAPVAPAAMAAASPVATAPLAATGAMPAPAPTSGTAAAPPPPRPKLRQRQAVAPDFRPLARARAKRPEAAARTAHRDTLHWLLGGALVAAGVVAGILIGGWLGLGVGAVLVLLGYYFVVLGLGGRQAWLEVFQEFFNM